MSQTPTFGFIGLGDMGNPMARQLLATGHPTWVWNRSPEKAQALVQAGAHLAASPQELLAKASHIGICVTSHEAVAAIALGPNGLLQAAPAQSAPVIIDFSTGAPEAARQMAEHAATLGVAWVDAPVSGGVPAATEGRLIVFAGGKAEAVAQAQPMLQAVASRVTHMGPSGSGQMTKICNQMMVATNILAMAETLALARKAGVSVERLPEALQGGFADSVPFQIFGPRMASHQFEPRLLAISIMRKDTGLAAAIANQVQASTPVLNAVRELYEQAGRVPGVDLERDLSRVIGLFEPLGSTPSNTGNP